MRPEAPPFFVPSAPMCGDEVPSRRQAILPGAPERRSAVLPGIRLPLPPPLPADVDALLTGLVHERPNVAIVYDSEPEGLEEWIGATLPAAATVLATEHDARVTELLVDGNRLLEEARAARRETAQARVEVDVWRTKALAWAAQLKRLDPAWSP